MQARTISQIEVDGRGEKSGGTGRATSPINIPRCRPLPRVPEGPRHAAGAEFYPAKDAGDDKDVAVEGVLFQDFEEGLARMPHFTVVLEGLDRDGTVQEPDGRTVVGGIPVFLPMGRKDAVKV